jgi:hypothetical protein
MTQKLWLCGMVRGNRAVLENSINHIKDYFDGLIFVVDDRANPADIEWLESIKKEGKIIVKKWVNDHAHTSNEILFSGVMNFRDYFAIFDETDKLNEVFVKDLRENIKYWDKNNVGCVHLDHPFVVRYTDNLRFTSSPHWTISGVVGHYVDLTKINGYLKESYLFNRRDILQSGFVRPAKYWFEYAHSNQNVLLYHQFSPEIYQQHENLRLQFRLFCLETLGIKLTLDSFIQYLKDNVGHYPPYFEQVLEWEVNLKDMFRLFVLNEPWINLHNNRFNFSYFKWKTTGLVNQPKDGDYVGLFNQYRQQKGLPPE